MRSYEVFDQCQFSDPAPKKTARALERNRGDLGLSLHHSSSVSELNHPFSPIQMNHPIESSRGAKEWQWSSRKNF